MKRLTFTPSPKYQTKLRLSFSLVALAILVAASTIAYLLSGDREIGLYGAGIFLSIVASLDFIFWLIAMILTPYYYRSLSFEIQDDEVIVRVGIWTKSVKHVPYRTVTNLTVKRDIMDRWLFGIGTLNIQTAGMSGTQGAEERLVGLINVQEVYEMVAIKLRRFRGAMAPTAAGVEGELEVESRMETETNTAHVLHAILDEVRSIRQTLATTSG